MDRTSKLYCSNAARLIGGVVAVAMVVGMSGCASTPPPKDQVSVAKTAVDNAINNGGPEYASAETKAARDKLEAAIRAMEKEDYTTARMLADEANIDAQLATAKARAAKAQQAAATTREGTGTLNRELSREEQLRQNQTK